MKKQKKMLISTGVIIFMLTSVIFTSCEQNNVAPDESALNNDLANAVIQTEIDDASESVDDIIDNTVVDFSDNGVHKSNDSKSSDEGRFLPDCVTITKVITGSTKMITLDYGDGCTTRNDNVLSGKIIMEINFNLEDKTIQINTTFDNFYFNDKKIEGEVNKSKIRLNENGNPEALINRNLTITWEDGSFVTVRGERKRAWIEGFGSGHWGDNVFSITGTWTVIKKDGTVKTSTIIEPLIRKMACRFLVSGTVDIQKGDKNVLLDYGDGTCDDLATVTINGEVKEIHLKKNRRR